MCTSCLSTAEFLLPKTNEILCFLYSFDAVTKREESRKTNWQKKKLFLSKNTWTLKCLLNWYFSSHDTISIRLSDGSRTPIDYATFCYRFDFCVHTIWFLLIACRNEISDGKSYYVVAPLRFHSYIFSNLPYLLNFALIILCTEFLQLLLEKTGDFKEVVDTWRSMCDAVMNYGIDFNLFEG